MHRQHFTYDELTPLEQCIAEFMARQQSRKELQYETTPPKKKPILNN